MDQNWFYLIEQASDMSKIKLPFIIHACCLKKQQKTINKLTAHTVPWNKRWVEKNATLYWTLSGVSRMYKHCIKP